jgi:hypothetical protein
MASSGLKACAVLVAVHALCLVALVGAQPEHHKDGAAVEHSKYVVVGAGPGGLQIGHFLQSAGRDYVILEQHDVAASFFVRYPRWRQLISINKPNTGRSDSFDYNSRHDWNSLLSEESHARRGGGAVAPCPPMRGREGAVSCWTSNFSSTDAARSWTSGGEAALFGSHTKEYYPHADVLAGFLQSWANGSLSGRGPALNIRYATSVTRVERPGEYAPKPSPLDRMSPEHDAWPRLKEVAEGAPRFQLQVRTAGVVSTLSCTYLIWAAGLQEPLDPWGINMPEALEKGWVSTYATASSRREDYLNKTVLILGRGNAAFEFASNVQGVAAFVHLVGSRRKRISLAIETHYPGDVRHIHSNLLESYMLQSLDGMTEATGQYLSFSRAPGSNQTRISDASSFEPVDEYGRPRTRGLLHVPYDFVIVCPGWRMARGEELFSPSTLPLLHSNGKHPAITPRYESKNVPGLFFAGNLAHALDFKKSSGGFIHGLRYTARALHRELEEEEQTAAAAAARSGAASTGVIAGSGWPRRPYANLRSLAEALLTRINNAAGTYQMFSSLCDVFVMTPVPVSTASNFSGPGPLAPFVEPWTFPPPRSEEAAYAASPARIIYWNTTATGGRGSSKSDRRTESAINAALTGALFEEVPVQLVGHKASTWAASLAAAFGLDARVPDALQSHAGAAPVLGTEYLTLTMEFGARPPPVAEGIASDGIPNAIHARADLQQDPYSLLRSVRLPNRGSTFVHPVLRYFHPALSAPALDPSSIEFVPSLLFPAATVYPIAEVHLPEDFGLDWKDHTTHILKLARFLQEVASRRLAVAAGIEKTLGLDISSTSVLSKGDVKEDVAQPLLTSGGVIAATGGAASEFVRGRAALAMTAAWATDRAPSAHAQSIYMAITSSRSKLYVRGRSVQGRAIWTSLSVQAVDDALGGSSGLYILHMVDPHPHPPSLNESTWTAAQAAEEKTIRAMEHFERQFVAVRRTPFSMPAPELTAAEVLAEAATAESINSLWLHVTGKIKGLVVITVSCRAGPDRLWVNSVLMANLSPEAHCGTSTALLIKDGEVVGALPLDETQDNMIKGLRNELTTAKRTKLGKGYDAFRNVVP